MSGTTPETRDSEARLAGFLRERAADEEYYFKSKFVADELNLTPSQVGRLVARLQDSTVDLEIEQWSYTNATTWRVTRK